CCRAALLVGMAWGGEPGDPRLGSELVTTRSVAARAALGTLRADRLRAHVERRRAARRVRYAVCVDGDAPPELGAADRLSARACCARTLLRGAFLAGGAVSHPERPAHLEILSRSAEAAGALGAALRRLGVEPTLVERRGRWMVTVRAGEGVGAALSVIGAQGGRLRYEEGRVVREMRAEVNRRINGETANLRRTADAAVRQVEAAGRLRGDPARWEQLPPGLREAAELRLRHPQESLARLAALAGISRSAMAGRLHRLTLSAQPPEG
ncbi:MAG TPA: DNA-binding protein WhiA, partial [Candidatus Dormibacteraeota bacterium]|nr:DNA-binding protein WhiA [Candidatus Dormibacteraeota bacterium]